MGSYNRLEKPVTGDTFKIVMFDTLYSIVAGVAFFSVLGYLNGIDSLVASAKGTPFAFISYPIAMENNL